MYRGLLVIGLFFILNLTVVNCIVCTPDFCASVHCKEVQNCKGPNQQIKPGGFCSCCNVCYTILGENEECSNLPIQGGPPPTTRCDKGLICYEGKCTSFKNLQNTAA